jgi:predicted RNA-binding Zn ribbon-like protein
MATEKTSLPTWFPDGDKPAPMPLMLVQAFLNTLDLEEGTDVLRDSDAAKRWFLATGLLDGGASLTRADLDYTREVRESIRGLLAHDAAARPDASHLRALRQLVDGHRARLSLGDRGVLELHNARRGDLGDALFELLLVIRRAQEDGTWKRLKACANPECAWVFYDRSRNQQGSWCDMAVCGNRVKNRNLRARRR